MTDDIRKLLGGYATGTLTAEEREALFAAALDDTQLFEALADEQALKELLEDSAARAELLRSTEAQHFTLGGLLREWLDRPKAKVLVAAGVIAVLGIGIRAMLEQQRDASSAETQIIAELRKPPQRIPAPVAPPPAAAVPQDEAEKQKAAPREMPRALKMPETRKAELPPAQMTAPPAASDALERQAAREPAVQVTASAPPPPPSAKEAPAPDSVTRVATAGELELKYTVLVRSAQGEFTPVPPDYAFTASDRARIRIESNRDGTLAILSGGNARTYVRNIAARTPTVLPTDFTFEQAQAQNVELTFLPVPPMTLSFTAQSEAARGESRLRDKAAGSASGAVIGGAQKAAADRGPGALTVHVTLGRK